MFLRMKVISIQEILRNDYYDTHPIPEGSKKEELILTDESINRAVARTMTEMFEFGAEK